MTSRASPGRGRRVCGDSKGGGGPGEWAEGGGWDGYPFLKGKLRCVRGRGVEVG